MSKAEKFIKDCTKNCSNEWYDDLSQGYESWLAPNEAKIAVEMTREEIYEWLEKNAHKYATIGIYTDAMITDLKQVMKDK